MKKIFAVFLSLIMATALIQTAFAADYTYLSKEGWEALASTTNQSFTADKMIDGNPSSYWHSDYRTEIDMDKPPFYLTFTLPEAATIGGWRYIPRTSNASGIVTGYNIYVSDSHEGKAELIFKGIMANSYDTKEVPFGFNVKDVKTVILEITEGMYNYGVVAEFDLMAGISSQSDKSISEASQGKSVVIGKEDAGLYSDMHIDKSLWKVTATTVNKNFVPENTIDGKKETYWHSDYRTESDMDKPPFYLTFNLGKAEAIGGFVYTPRTDNSAGIVTEYGIYVSDSDSGKAKLVYEGKMDSNFLVKEIAFDNNISGVKTLIFEIKAGAYNFGTCAEFDLIKPIDGKETKTVENSALGNKTVEIGTNKIEGSSSDYYEDKASWTVTASSAYKKNGIANAFDGREETIWHTDYTDDGVATVLTKVEGPHWIEIVLPYERYISGFTYLPRTGQTTGIFTGYELYGAASDDGDWVLLKSGSWKGDFSEKKEDFLKNLKVKKVKLVSTATVAGYGTCAEFDLKIPSEKLENEENLSSYEGFFLANKIDKIDLSGASATATSEWEGKNPAMNVLDGNQRVAWHTDPADKDKFPVILTVDLGDIYTISEIEYAPRIDDTTKHGVWLDFSVWASTDGEDYFPAIENTGLQLNLDNQRIKFDKPVTGRYFEFEINEGYRGYVTCGDLFFYERAVDTEEREAEVKEKYVLQIGSNVIKTTKAGVESEKTIDVAPFIDSGYTQIPLRGLLEEMGASLTWDGERQKIDITGSGIEINMQIMNDAVYVTNDRLGRVRYTLQTPPQIKDSRTFVPLRFISENLGYKVEWNGETQEITITK